MSRRRVALLGGSSAFTPALAAALADRAADLPALELRLLGRHAGRTAAVARFSNQHARARDVDHHYQPTVALDDALAGADVVVCQLRVGGFEGRSHDETFPLAHGLPGDETIGPGGLASALRSVPVFLRFAHRAAALAPRAPFVQMSNPLGISLRALAAVPGLASFGLCELPERTLRRACALVGADAGHVEGRYLGLNHQGFFVSIRDREGRELLPTILSRLAALEDPGAFAVDGAAMQRWGALLLPYARLYEHTAREVAAARARRRDRGQELEQLASELFAHYAATADTALPEPLRRRATPWNEMALVPALVSLFDRRPRRLAVSEQNGGYLSELPPDAVVEKWGPQVPTHILAAEIAALDVDAPRTARILAFLRQLCDFERAAVEVARAPTAAGVIDCLHAHPLGVPSGSDVRALARDVLRPVEVGLQQAGHSS